MWHQDMLRFAGLGEASDGIAACEHEVSRVGLPFQTDRFSSESVGRIVTEGSWPIHSIVSSVMIY